MRERWSIAAAPTCRILFRFSAPAVRCLLTARDNALNFSRPRYIANGRRVGLSARSPADRMIQPEPTHPGPEDKPNLFKSVASAASPDRETGTADT